MNNPDVVVIGAGAAGISAAQTLLELGLNVLVVEAENHIGGRCWTDMETFGVPYDVGAHWLHFGDNNFYVPYGQKMGFDIYPDSRNVHLFENSREIDCGFSSISNSRSLYEAAIGDAASQGLDTSIAEATEHISDPNKKTIEFILGPWVMGKEASEISVIDHETGADGADWFCREGFGTLVAHYGSTLPISLDTNVTAIDWSGTSVKIETNRGIVRTRVVILTVSTGVLAKENIRFQPQLSTEKQESFHGISMGCYEHVVLQFSDGDFFEEFDSYIVRKANEQDDGIGALINIRGSGLTFCDIGGNRGRDLIDQGEAACIDYAINELTRILGSEVKKGFVKGASSSWLTHPRTEGSYAGANPGAAHLRSVLRNSVGERIFFAGEACHPSLWATVAGAHTSGHQVAIEAEKIMTKRI